VGDVANMMIPARVGFIHYYIMALSAASCGKVVANVWFTTSKQQGVSFC